MNIDRNSEKAVKESMLFASNGIHLHSAADLTGSIRKGSPRTGQDDEAEGLEVGVSTEHLDDLSKRGALTAHASAGSRVRP